MKSVVTIESALLQKHASFSFITLEAIYHIRIRWKSPSKEIQLYADKQHSPVFQAMQDALGDKAEVVIIGWMKELRKKENNFRKSHRHK